MVLRKHQFVFALHLVFPFALEVIMKAKLVTPVIAAITLFFGATAMADVHVAGKLESSCIVEGPDQFLCCSWLDH